MFRHWFCAAFLGIAATSAAAAATGAWITDGRPSPQARQLLRVMADAAEWGLRPEDYDAVSLADAAARLARGASSVDLQRFDEALDDAAARLVRHLHFGRIDPRAAGFELPDTRAPLDIAAIVAEMARATDVAGVLGTVEPSFHHYALLKTALQRYRRLAADTTLTRLPPLPARSVRAGGPYVGAPALRRLLFALGDLPATNGDSTTLDPALVAAIVRFQQRHGLEADGILGEKTWAALATPLAQRVRQIELTLERWRWLPAFTTPPIIVNIPQFRLFAFETLDDRAASITQMDVIVGQTYQRTRTPVFVGDLRTVVFRPYWDVPRSITVAEMLPQIRRDVDYLRRNHLELVDGAGDASPVRPPTAEAIAALEAGRLRLRQRPGEDNSLGLVKFLFPNAHNVYIHSTPAHQLFAQARRAFSHGCIRASDPVGLAEFVLRNATSGWDRARITQAMQGADNQRVTLQQPVRVMILYATVLATEEGPILFFDDLYGLDRRLAQLLETPGTSAPRTAASGYHPRQLP